MKNTVIVAAVVILVAGVAWFKHQRPSASDAPADNPTTRKAAASQPLTKPLPRLVELGAGKCEACKKMAPIIEQLKAEYAGRVIVESIDVIKEPQQARPYNWRLIPVQVFFNADGNEVWRHEGFLPKADIIAKFTEMGVK